MAEFFVLLVIVYTPSLNVAVLVCIYTAVTANTRIIGKEVSSTRCTDRTSLSVTSASNRQHLRSATAGLLYVPRARTATRRDVRGPTVWNSLPDRDSADLKQSEQITYWRVLSAS